MLRIRVFSCLLWPHLLWGNLQKTNLSTKMSDIKDTASVTLNVNGAQAKQVIYALFLREQPLSLADCEIFLPENVLLQLPE